MIATPEARAEAEAYALSIGHKTWRQVMMDDAGHTEFSVGCGPLWDLITSRWDELYVIAFDDQVLELLQTPDDIIGPLLGTLRTRCDPRAWARVVGIERCGASTKHAYLLLRDAPLRSEEWPSGLDDDEIDFLLDQIQALEPDRYEKAFRMVELRRAGMGKEG